MEPKIEQDLLSKLAPGRAIALDGPNFSGRTDLLRSLTGLEDRSEIGISPATLAAQPTVYIGPEIYNSISGLCSTVQEELRLHTGYPLQHALIAELAEEFGLLALYDRNPFTLSGGEQALLTIISGVALNSFILAVDCALEQIEPSLKMRLLGWLQSGRCRETSIVIADNRMSECKEFGSLPHFTSTRFRLPFQRRLCFDPIRADIDLPIRLSRPSCLLLDSIKFHYRRGPRVLTNVSVQLEPGKLYMLQGRNGAGKSTLAKLLSGVLKPDDGRIFAGETGLRPWRQPGQLVAYHFQNPDLQLFSTSVEDEIQAGPRALRLNPDECAQRSEALMLSFGLSHIGKEHPLDLPFVVRKRVALAATLAMGCPWVILDEPTLGQDMDSSEAVAKIINGLLALDTGVIVISHSLWLRRRLPAKSLRLEGGMVYGNEGGEPSTC